VARIEDRFPCGTHDEHLSVACREGRPSTAPGDLALVCLGQSSASLEVPGTYRALRCTVQLELDGDLTNGGPQSPTTAAEALAREIDLQIGLERREAAAVLVAERFIDGTATPLATDAIVVQERSTTMAIIPLDELALPEGATVGARLACLHDQDDGGTTAPWSATLFPETPRTYLVPGSTPDLRRIVPDTATPPVAVAVTVRVEGSWSALPERPAIDVTALAAPELACDVEVVTTARGTSVRATSVAPATCTLPGAPTQELHPWAVPSDAVVVAYPRDQPPAVRGTGDGFTLSPGDYVITVEAAFERYLDRLDVTADASCTSSNPAVATVDDDCVVRALAAGTTELQVTAAGDTFTAAITVEEVCLAGDFQLDWDDGHEGGADGSATLAPGACAEGYPHAGDLLLDACTAPASRDDDFYVNSSACVRTARARRPQLVQQGTQAPAICSFEEISTAVSHATAAGGSLSIERACLADAGGAGCRARVILDNGQDRFDVTDAAMLSTSDASIAEVSNAPGTTGTLLPRGAGDVDLRAFYAGLEAVAPLTVHPAFDTIVQDPADLIAPTAHPSLDLRQLGVRIDGTTVTIHLRTNGPWPAPDLFSRYEKVELFAPGSNTPAITIVDEIHAGVPAQTVTGIAPANVTFTSDFDGLVITITGAPVLDRVRAETGMIAADGDPFIQDHCRAAGDAPFTIP
jgi:hypothetical protein